MSHRSMELAEAAALPPADPDRTILDLFGEQVRARPDATSVSSGALDISYAELDASADRVAAWLVGQGVGPEAVVATEVERGPHLVAALIGILKAGAAYLALEPDMPQSRRDRLIADAGASAVVTGADRLRPPGLPTLRLPDDLEGSPPGRRITESRAPSGWGRSERLACVCYTSGSTGRPRGVAVPHRAVVRLVSGDWAEFGPGHTFLCLSPVSFDASTFEIWGPLLTGGRLVIHPPGPLMAEELAAVVREKQVTTLWLTAGLFHHLADHHLEALAGLRQLIAGGDVLRPAQVNRFLDRFPETRFVNGYGPTENTTFTACHTVREPVRAGSVPIGRPITGTTVYVLDDRFEPAPSGTSGELYAAGAGLSRGYLGQPRETAVRFVPDPFGTPGGRMYRTGDVVRQDPAGVLEFVGRADRQVKIRGFRVEPAEVEREISTIPGIREVAVAAHGGPGNEKRLTAYLVPDPDGGEPARLGARVRRSLRQTLPAAMIPAVFVTVDRLPLTPHGKVDRAALPAPECAARQADADFVAPRSPTEQLLCDMWAESLGVDAVGALDDYFELGGNSLAAMDLLTWVETVFDVDLPVRALLYHPTVEEFARAVDERVALRGAPA